MSQSQDPPKTRPRYNHEANRNVMDEGRLYEAEFFWRDHYIWLTEQGYLLSPRYHPGWVASWIKDPTKDWLFCEDGQIVAVRES